MTGTTTLESYSMNGSNNSYHNTHEQTKEPTKGSTYGAFNDRSINGSADNYTNDSKAEDVYHVFSNLPRGRDSDYMSMGKDLLNAMQIYDLHMRVENQISPSTSPDGAQLVQENGEKARRQVVELAEKILASSMEPRANLMVSSLQYHFCSCLKVAVDLNIAQHIPKHSSVSARDLSRLTGAEEGLLNRIMRVLVTKFVFEEASPGVYRHTSVSWTMTAPGQKHLLTHRLEEGFRSASREAEALRSNKYREPVLSDQYGFHLAFDTESNFWEYTTKYEPKLGKNFNSAMKVVSMNDLEMIPSLYPFDRLSENGGLLVDVGGGLGQVGRKIVSHYNASGLRCIVQDRLVAADTTSHRLAQNGDDDSSSSVTMQKHDFFDPQPVQGAAAYFFRHIFHDWPDSACITILRQTIPAMDTNSSRILICDQVVEDENPAPSSILYDIDMMTMYGGKERKLSEWKKLLEETDSRLYISDVRSAPAAPNIIEVRLR